MTKHLDPAPDGWQVVSLGEVARERMERAGSAPGADVFSVTKYAGLVRSGDYFDRRVFSRDTRNYKVVRRGDFAYATIHLDEGSLGLLRDADVGIISPMYTVFEADVTCVDREFLFALMKLPQMVARYQRIAEGTVHRRKSISFERLGRLAVAIPPLPEQRAIAAVLDGIDEAIERTEEVIAATERVREALLHELLTRGLPGRHSEWVDVPGLGTVPACWDIVRLGDLVDVLDARRIPLSSDERAGIGGTYPYYGANGVVDYIDRWIFDEASDLILLAEDGGHFDEFRTRPIAYRVSGRCWVNNHAHVLRVRDRLQQDFLFSALANKDIRSFINGTTRSKLTQADLLQITIGVPTEAGEAVSIASALNGVEDTLEEAREERARLQSLQASAADALLTGRVRVGGLGHALR